MQKDGTKVKLWAMYGWFRVFKLADDGQHLVTGYNGMNLVPKSFDGNEVMIRFHRKGELIQMVTLKDLFVNLGSMKKTASHYSWGWYLGFNPAGQYEVETEEGRILAFDPKTGQQTKRSDPPKAEKSPQKKEVPLQTKEVPLQTDDGIQIDVVPDR